jgi:hypothetical protein
VLLLIRFDLTNADLVLFDRYEAAVLAMLPDHGAVLERRLRAVDRSAETHLIRFPDLAAFDAFIMDPRRLAMARTWTACGAGAARQWVDDHGSGEAMAR